MEAASAVKESGRARNLERDRIVAEALMLIDEVGFAGLTLRTLATRLKVKAAALYWHFENKQDLIDAMAASIVLDSFKTTAPAGSSWRELFAWVARTNRKALLLHRDGAQVMAHANMRQTSMLEGLEAFFGRLAEQGFSGELAMQGVFVVIRYTLGCVFEEQADPAIRQQRIAERAKHLETNAGQYPLVAKTLVPLIKKQQQDPAFMFEQGLQIILDGIGHCLAVA